MTSRLKAAHIIPPVIALVLAGGWIGGRRQLISTLENESVLLQKHIAAARTSGPAADTAHAKPAGSAEIVKDHQPLDLKIIAAQLADRKRDGGAGDYRVLKRLQDRLNSMTNEELASAIDEAPRSISPRVAAKCSK